MTAVITIAALTAVATHQAAVNETPYHSFWSSHNFCQGCGSRPRFVNDDGYEYPFCGKTCAKANLGTLHVGPITSQNPCLGCGNLPQAINPTTGTPYPHCSRSCARKWPLLSTVCALSSCSSRVTGRFGSYCSRLHRDLAQGLDANRTLRPGQYSLGSPLSAQTSHTPFAPPIGRMSKSNPLPHSEIRIDPNASSRKRMLFYEKNAPHYGFTNFSNHPVKYRGKSYPTSEHLFQALKFLDHKPHIAEKIRKGSDNPRDAFNEAHKYKNDVRPDWKRVNIDMMDVALYHKFSQHKTLKAELLATGDDELVEDSPVDSFWGIGHDRRGRNELGKALMRLRTQFQASPT